MKKPPEGGLRAEGGAGQAAASSMLVSNALDMGGRFMTKVGAFLLGLAVSTGAVS